MTQVSVRPPGTARFWHGTIPAAYVILVLSDLGLGVGGQLAGRVTGRTGGRWAQREGERTAVAGEAGWPDVMALRP